MREVVDRFGELTAQVNELNQNYYTWRDANQQLRELTESHDAHLARLELLRYQVTELQALELLENELEQLHQEHKQQANAETLQYSGNQLLTVLTDDERFNVLSGLQQAMQLLPSLNLDTSLSTVSDSLQQAHIQISEAITDIRNYVGSINNDPQRLQTIETRLQQIHDMARKHHIPAEQLHQHLNNLQEELTRIENADKTIADLQKNIEQASQQYFVLAKKLTAARSKAATKLTTAMNKSITKLGMPEGKFSIELEAINTTQPTAYGTERVTFCVSTNPGQPIQPISKVASGGELSRMSLALQVLTASKHENTTMIFDEVDTGIGGNTAVIVGEHLRALGSNAQILCVTHLAQVAALGHNHMQVSKRVENNETYTSITTLNQAARTAEIARMLGGKADSKQSLAHAKEMLAM